ncbi:MAG: hypothetical protein NC337_02960 [Roseburia sp.]|nr:hypothetical protein [Roseburia sp.]
MKVLHVTTIDVGGAYKAALRLHEGLTRLGVQSEILLRIKTDYKGRVWNRYLTKCARCRKWMRLFCIGLIPF